MEKRRDDTGKRVIYHRWTGWELSQLRVLAKTEGYVQIAARLGLTPEAVRLKCHRMRIPVTKHGPGVARVCPRCGRPIVEGTAASRDGVCRVCREADKAAAMEEQESLMRERRRYDASKKRIREMRRKEV